MNNPGKENGSRRKEEAKGAQIVLSPICFLQLVKGVHYAEKLSEDCFPTHLS